MANIQKPNSALPIENAHNRRDRTQVKDRHFIPEPYKNVAEGMEKQFAEYMLEQMDNSVDRTDESSSSMDYYDSVMREERAEMMAKNSELGLQKTILDQIYPERMRNQFSYQRYLNSKPAIKKNAPTMGQPTQKIVTDKNVGNGGSNE
tara:strand:+ start:20880 stop:21323 length:444 start_codon:yes stop_codon:yes gene_type:complete